MFQSLPYFFLLGSDCFQLSTPDQISNCHYNSWRLFSPMYSTLKSHKKIFQSEKTYAPHVFDQLINRRQKAQRNIYIYLYIHTYTDRKRERERNNFVWNELRDLGTWNMIFFKWFLLMRLQGGGEMSPGSFGDLVTVLCVHWKKKMDDQKGCTPRLKQKGR